MSDASQRISESRNYWAIALEPVHVGTGGERMGRVDLTVLRDPVLEVPKIPGTSISGALKFFADLNLRDKGIKMPADKPCASTAGDKNCTARNACPICCAFGYTDDATESRQGILKFTDAALFAFPVPTMKGPVWVTTKPILHDVLGVGNGIDIDMEQIKIPMGSVVSPVENKLNLGWLYLDTAPDSSLTIGTQKGLPEGVGSRLLVLPTWLFSHVVNDNMEVRTSVSIDPKTGAASDKALFTYEAVPRGAIFAMSIVADDFGNQWPGVNWNGKDSIKPIDMLSTCAFPGIRTVGFGGMTTRGFGRMNFVCRNGAANSEVTHG